MTLAVATVTMFVHAKLVSASKGVSLTKLVEGKVIDTKRLSFDLSDKKANNDLVSSSVSGLPISKSISLAIFESFQTVLYQEEVTP